MTRGVQVAAAVTIALVLAVVGFVITRPGAPTPAPAPAPAVTAASEEPTVLFIVLDTVRADHLGLCGYERPTSPYLEKLVKQGASYTCRAYAPGSWTLPSHASFFTGEQVLTHRAHEVTSGVKNWKGSGARTAKLDKALPTLAEHFTEQGYRSIMLSGNPVVGRKMGLGRGFETVKKAKKFGGYRDRKAAEAVEELLGTRGEADPRPLFFFVNLADAHTPWRPITKKRPKWLPEERKVVHWAQKSPDTAFRRFLGNRMPEPEATDTLAQATDLYDWGVFRADRSLKFVVEKVKELGWCEPGCRLVVTSDHGEFLGEQQLLDHGFYTYEANSRVFLLMQDEHGKAPEMPEPVSAIESFYLARDGAFPETLNRVETVAWPHVRRCKNTDGEAFCKTQASLWSGTEKITWTDGELTVVDVVKDPLESAPAPLPDDHPRRDELLELAEIVKVQTNEEDADRQMTEESVIEMLRAAGYVD